MLGIGFDLDTAIHRPACFRIVSGDVAAPSFRIDCDSVFHAMALEPVGNKPRTFLGEHGVMRLTAPRIREAGYQDGFLSRLNFARHSFQLMHAACGRG